MIRQISFAMTLLMAAQAAATTHSVHLLDGSIMRGEVLSLDKEQLALSTSFAGTLAIDRELIAAIFLTDMPALPAGNTETGLTAAVDSSQVGTIEVAIKGDRIRSSVEFRDESDRERMAALNTLRLRVYVDGRLFYEDTDAEMEKDYFSSGHRKLVNENFFAPASLQVPAGKHHVTISIGNDLDLLKHGERQGSLAFAEVSVDEVMVFAEELTRIKLEGKGSKMRHGPYELTVLGHR